VVKWHCKNDLYMSMDSSCDAPYTSWEYGQAVSEIGPTIAVGSVKAQSNQSEERSDTKGGYQLPHPEPHRGDPVLSSFVSESGLGDFLHAPLWVGM
jgi:hypothetical protein